ncbi:glutathionylspermidine synthase family protein [Bacillus sp. FJAT-45037]|uniref:glutathionylspermidine synthase family protein n=1 Tax=Bacillus sp. FJAT-45037 TaxID=2011007 RepID=UPI0012FE3875|nr:glutathionylspermidine synthase family protein [Bacillus sp. FJAT-45037]
MEDNFTRRRNAFYNKFDSFWDRLYGIEYSLFDCHTISDLEKTHIRRATNEAYKIFKKTNELVKQADDETFLKLGLPEKTIPFLRQHGIGYETVIGRFDFVLTAEGLKILEFNADTPTFIRELFEVNGAVCKEFGFVDPNQGMDENVGEVIRDAVYRSARQIGVHGHPYVVFTAHANDIEDRQTMMYLMNLAAISDATFVPLDQLHVNSEGDQPGVYDLEGKKIDVVYRHTYPLEALIEDQTEDGFAIGEAFLELVSRGQVAILNPPSAFLMQTKAMLALIWGMHEKGHPYFTEDEHRHIASYFLPTYLDEDPFIETGDRYVSKPVFGREGDTVFIKQSGKQIKSQKKQTYNHYLKIYQTYVDLPKTWVKTEEGKKEVHLLIGSFVVGEQASAFGLRAGAAITDNLSYFLPCGVKGEN